MTARSRSGSARRRQTWHGRGLRWLGNRVTTRSSRPAAESPALLYHGKRRPRPPALSRRATHAGSRRRGQGSPTRAFSLEAQLATSWRGAWGLAEGTPSDQGPCPQAGDQGADGRHRRALQRRRPRPRRRRGRCRRTDDRRRRCRRTASTAGSGAEEPTSAAAGPIDAEAAAGETIAADPAAAGPAAAQPPAAGPTADSGAPLTEVIACASRTLAASSARIEIRTDTDLGREPVPALRRPLRRRPGCSDGSPGERPGRPWDASRPDTDPAELSEHFLHQFGAGFIDLAGRPVPRRLRRLRPGAGRRPPLRRPVR